MSDTERLVVSIVHFLGEQLRSDTITNDAKESLEVAIQCLESAYNVSSSDTHLMVSKSLKEIFEEVSRKEPIVKDAEASYRDKEEAERLKNEGNDLMKQERYEDALKNYTKAIQLDNKNPVYFCNRAAAYSKLSNHVFALEDCQRAIEIDPKYSKAYGRMGLAYASMNDHAKAKQFYEKAIELDPYNETFRNNLRIAEEKKMEQQRENPFLNLFNDIGIESMMSNPAVLNFASRMMSGDQSAQSAFSQMLGSFVPNAGNSDNGENRQEGGMPDFSHFLRAGQQFVEQIQQTNPDVVEQMRRQFTQMNQSDADKNEKKDDQL